MKPLAHLELHSNDARRAHAFLLELCGWRARDVDTRWGYYLALAAGADLDAGIVEGATPRPLWLPYAEVEAIGAATERARRAGAAVLLAPREGPTGWRSVVSSATAGRVALWQPKR
jgi:predicted enzyme related to lactoylglutathione lyase